MFACQFSYSKRVKGIGACCGCLVRCNDTSADLAQKCFKFCFPPLLSELQCFQFELSSLVSELQCLQYCLHCGKLRSLVQRRVLQTLPNMQWRSAHLVQERLVGELQCFQLRFHCGKLRFPVQAASVGWCQHRRRHERFIRCTRGCPGPSAGLGDDHLQQPLNLGRRFTGSCV